MGFTENSMENTKISNPCENYANYVQVSKQLELLVFNHLYK